MVRVRLRSGYHREQKWVGRLLSAAAALIAISTVYGRYHYLVDMVGGVLMAGTAVLLARSLRARTSYCGN